MNWCEDLRGKYKDIPLSIVGCGPSYDYEVFDNIGTPIFAINAAITDLWHYMVVWWVVHDLQAIMTRDPKSRKGFIEPLEPGGGWRKVPIITDEHCKDYAPESAFFYSDQARRDSGVKVRGSLEHALDVACLWGFRPICLYGIDMNTIPDKRPKFERWKYTRYYAQAFQWKSRPRNRLKIMAESTCKNRSRWHGDIYISRKSLWTRNCPFERMSADGG